MSERPQKKDNVSSSEAPMKTSSPVPDSLSAKKASLCCIFGCGWPSCSSLTRLIYKIRCTNE